MAHLAYIEGDVPVLGLDHFIHTHILREEPDYSVSMLYGRQAIRLPNSALRLYSCESLTLQFDWMGEACHSFTEPPHTRGLTLRSPNGTLGMGLVTWVTMRVEVTIPLTVTPSLAFEMEPPPLPGTLTGMLL
jgi:hypothetical protein